MFLCQIPGMLSALIASPLGRFRIVAFLEGVSYLLLGITMPLKYLHGMPGPNYVVGMAHGLLFVLYVSMLLLVYRRYRWSLGKTALAFLAALLPFGTFVAEWKLYGRD
jgi:integral membrane protein